MKNIKLIKNGLVGVSIVIFCVCCTDNSYLIDSGRHDANFDGNIYEYLKAKPVHFDSLTKVIELAQMEDVFENDTITFFAPSNPSIIKTIEALNKYLINRGRPTVNNLNQIDPKIWKEFVSLYIIKDKYLLKDIPQLDTIQLNVYGGQGFISYQGRPMNVGVVYFDAGGVQYAGYRQLYYSYINDFNNNIGSMLNVAVASSDIQPNNGAVHVLKYDNHDFGFKVNDFINKAVAEGIKEN